MRWNWLESPRMSYGCVNARAAQEVHVCYQKQAHKARALSSIRSAQNGVSLSIARRRTSGQARCSPSPEETSDLCTWMLLALTSLPVRESCPCNECGLLEDQTPGNCPEG